MIRSLKQLYVSFFNWLVSFVPPQDFNDVLIIRLDQLGDFILWLDSAKEYRKLYHNKHLTLLVNGNWYDLAKSLPYWDEVIPLDTMKFRLNPCYRLQMLMFIRKQGFEICICPRHSVKFTLEPPIVAISGAQQKIVCEGSFPIEKQNYFTRSIPMRPDVHELCRNADFLRGLGRKDFKSTVPQINISRLSPTAKKMLPNIVICPGSFRKRKEWPLKRFITLMHRLYGHQIFVCNDKKIEGLPSHVCDLTGHTQLIRFVSLIANASLVIANDSAGAHLAAALDVPSICIMGSELGRFFPYEKGIEKTRDGMVLPKLIYKPNVKDITVEEVWDVLKGMI
jgi:ADP-heptose:LPS heptosyltransferase